MTAVVLAWTLGGVGAHKFYVGRKTEGILSVFFCVTLIPALAALIEGFQYLSMDDQTFWHDYCGLPVPESLPVGTG